jgi:hypothetical protein
MLPIVIADKNDVTKIHGRGRGFYGLAEVGSTQVKILQGI